MNNLRIATRGSKLALWQANFVATKLTAAGFHCELVIIKTEGDKILHKPLYDIGGKSLFIKELEQALLDDKADIAVHSLKDVPAKLDQAFELPAILARHSYHDVIIFDDENFKLLHQHSGCMFLPKNWGFLDQKTIGTSSLRRQNILMTLATAVKVKSLRGNIDTRLQKLTQSSEFDAIILAEASLERLGLQNDYHYLQLDPTVFVPCAGQGAMTIECLAKSPFASAMRKLNCEKTEVAVQFERSIVAALGADCKTPIGCLATPSQDSWDVYVKVIAPGGEMISIHRESPNLDHTLKQEIFGELRQHRYQALLMELGLRVPK